MANPDSGFATNLLHEYVYEGLWWRHNQSIIRRWVWTLTNRNAILVLGGLGLLLTFSQTRAWVVLREIIYHHKKSVRLDGDTSPDHIRHLTQGNAIEDILPSVKYQLSKFGCFSRQVQPDSSVISPVFGIIACLNIGVFIVMGVAIPLLISEGTLGEALVKTKMTNGCLKDSTLNMDIQSKTDSIFRLCQDGLAKDCASHYRIQQPRLERRRLEKCVFPGDICVNSTKSLEITHSNITTTELGVNSKSLVTMSHRLTCSPIQLESFLVPSNSQFPHSRANISVCDQKIYNNPLEPEEMSSTECEMPLKTWNGPNRFDNSSSGYLASQGPYEIKVLPSSYFPESLNSEGKLRKEIRRDDGLPFLVIHRAGKSKHIYSVDDPFFASHKPCDEYYRGKKTSLTMHCPDHEATALGCLEQHQYCLPESGFCTPWGYQYAQLWEAKKYLGMEWEQSLITQMWAIETAFNYSSVYQVLFKRENPEISQSMTPLTRTSPWNPDFAREIMYNREDQWITEVETWFRKGILDAILRIQYAGRYREGFYYFYTNTGIRSDNGFMAKAKDFPPCDLLLFNDTDYTNIFLFGFWLTIFLLVSICIASYKVDWLRRAINAIRKRPFKPTYFAKSMFSFYSSERLPAWADWLSRSSIRGFLWRLCLARRLKSDESQPRASTHAPHHGDMEHDRNSIPLEASGA